MAKPPARRPGKGKKKPDPLAELRQRVWLDFCQKAGESVSLILMVLAAALLDWTRRRVHLETWLEVAIGLAEGLTIFVGLEQLLVRAVALARRLYRVARGDEDAPRGGEAPERRKGD